MDKRFEVTEKGVFAPDGKEIEVGTIFAIGPDEDIPNMLKNKARMIRDGGSDEDLTADGAGSGDDAGDDSEARALRLKVIAEALLPASFNNNGLPSVKAVNDALLPEEEAYTSAEITLLWKSE